MGMSASFFTTNRQKIALSLKGGLVVMCANNAVQRSNDTAYTFTQEPNFWYLTGINEPDWWVIVDGKDDKSWLVAPNINDTQRIFEGGLSHTIATERSGIKNIISHQDGEALLRELAKKHSIIYSLGDHPQAKHFNFTENPAQKKLWTVVERIFNSVQDCRLELAKMRAIKQPVEIAAIKKAISFTSQAFEIVQARLPELTYEYEIEAEFDYHFKKNGVSHAYDPIVAGGQNACTLHYNKNNAKLKKNTLVVMDVGARFHGYAADITRTYPVGQPTKRQITVHAAVEDAHHEIIQLLKPGVSTSAYHEAVDAIMRRALVGLGLMKGTDDENSYRRYFPHAVSHGLGIDVHDSLGRATSFEPGMVLTVEPGIYIPEEKIGVRIEDDILITVTGHENLSRRLPTSL